MAVDWECLKCQKLQEKSEFRNVGNVETSSVMYIFSEPRARAHLNDGNFRNGRDFRNVGTDIKCPTFLEPQPQADLNDDENFRNGRNVIIDMCHTILETQTLAD